MRNGMGPFLQNAVRSGGPIARYTPITVSALKIYLTMRASISALERRTLWAAAGRKGQCYV